MYAEGEKQRKGQNAPFWKAMLEFSVSTVYKIPS